MILNETYFIIAFTTNIPAVDIYRSFAAHVLGVVGENDDGTMEPYRDDDLAKEFEDSLKTVVNRKGFLLPATHTQHDVILCFSKQPTQYQLDIINQRRLSFSETFSQKDKMSDYLSIDNIVFTDINVAEVSVKTNIITFKYA